MNSRSSDAVNFFMLEQYKSKVMKAWAPLWERCFSVGKDTHLRVKNKTMTCFFLATTWKSIDLIAPVNISLKNLNSRGETYIFRLAKC